MTRSTAFALLCGLLAATLLAAGPAAAGDAAAGRKKAQVCQPCHGLDGIAKIPMAPNLAGNNELYLRKQLEAFRSGQRTNEMMSVVAKGLSDADIANVAAWYSSIEITVKLPPAN
ncbi:Cytochrome c553 [Tistlia consotensis]|uniref:Cytochrome c553 n=1 Tax=Tistlia consotensis USBA 355 TaxID=560819 RepID=A0A1Y6BC42_9PROT|nr:cytochrome c [Tistlia consotensis]SMF02365.1 Cytochrome c553 [Tistlia consotensis USBA 355]SNS26807.1 Cytochrome c553 [Tistlia consotensis]